MSSTPRAGTPSNAAPNHGSTTVTTTEAGPSAPFNFSSGTLRLRAEEAPAEPEQRRRIQWAEDVIDNEGMGKKSSKVCCIYHKPKTADESSGEDSSSSSSSDSDSDSGPDASRAQPANRGSRRHRHAHHDNEPCDHGAGPADGHSHPPRHKQKERRRSPNAYERVPKKKQPKDARP